jgi:hypothetical protein
VEDLVFVGGATDGERHAGRGGVRWEGIARMMSSIFIV